MRQRKGVGELMEASGRTSVNERTKIYHVVLFDYGSSLYVFFKGCNFACRGCILKSTPWDCHIPKEDVRRLSSLDIELLRTLTLSELERIVVATSVKSAVLGGGEPTVDPSLPRVIELFKDYGVHTVLLTNGHALDEKLTTRLEAAGLNEVCVSIKAVTEEIHERYTGKSNRKVLRNFKFLRRSKMELRAETVLIPGLVERGEVEKIAAFIASIDKSIPLRIDGYTAIPHAEWRSATPSEVLDAVKSAKKHLKNVSCLHCEVPIKGNVVCVYP
ncbi:MAG: radical SAM protein [Candidatus Alkanophagales archaeon]|nr:MAG: radical SAM protein [Candidatus Alkanophagales archaeon]